MSRNRLCVAWPVTFVPVAALTLALVLAPTPASAPAADKPAEMPALEEALKNQGPAVVKYLKEHHYRNVGVLKFLVQKGKSPASDNVGTLNHSLADRLEVALALALDAKKPEIRLLEKASDRAASELKGGKGHLTETGRKALFQPFYKPAWDDSVADEEFRQKGDRGFFLRADAFLTGEVKFASDWQTITVTIQAFDKTGAKLAEVCTFKAATSLHLLTEAGVSFAASRGFDDGGQAAVRDERVVLADRLKPRPTREADNTDYSPLEAPDSPIEFKVFYNNEEQKLDNGRVPEPKEKDKVRFVLRHRGRDQGTYGVVLKVNGLNTLYKEEDDDLNCYKWILKPGGEVKIDGFQTKGDNEKADPFVVSSPEKSKLDEVHYGHHAGTFSVVVFRSRISEQDHVDTLVKQDQPEVYGISKGTLEPNGRVGKLGALQADLKKSAGIDKKMLARASKGLIQGDSENKVPSRVSETPGSFQAYEAPVMSATIRYYDLQTKSE